MARNLQVQELMMSAQSEAGSGEVEFGVVDQQGYCWRRIGHAGLVLGLLALSACQSDPNTSADPMGEDSGGSETNSPDAASSAQPTDASTAGSTAADAQADGSAAADSGGSAAMEPSSADDGAAPPSTTEAGAAANGGATDSGAMNGGATDSGAMNGGAMDAGADAAHIVPPPVDAGAATADAGSAPVDAGPVLTPTPCAAPAGTDYAATLYTPPQGCFLNSFNLQLAVNITSEQQFAQTYACSAGITSGIDFTQQQLFVALARERTSAELSYVHIDDAGGIKVGLVSPVYCGGAFPPNIPVPVLMNRSLRSPVSQLCTVGQCVGLPLP